MIAKHLPLEVCFYLLYFKDYIYFKQSRIVKQTPKMPKQYLFSLIITFQNNVSRVLDVKHFHLFDNAFLTFYPHSYFTSNIIESVAKET